MTSSTGCSGLIFVGSPPIFCMASRIAARSTTQGTPVKSCNSTRATVNAISLVGSAFASHCERRDVVGAHVHAVLGTEQILQQYLERKRA